MGSSASVPRPPVLIAHKCAALAQPWAARSTMKSRTETGHRTGRPSHHTHAIWITFQSSLPRLQSWSRLAPLLGTLAVWLVLPLAWAGTDGFSPRSSNFHHSAWTTKEGAPGDTWAVVQTPDGWMWLGGPRGLFRFDGVQFERVDLNGRDPTQSAAIYALWAEESGDLWIGYTRGGASRLHEGHVSHYPAPAGYATSSIMSFRRDGQGNLWAACNKGLLRLEGERWHAVGPEMGFTDSYVTTMHLDQSGTLWLAGKHYLYRLRRGASRFERTEIGNKDYTSFLQAPDGRSWYSDAEGIHLLPDQVAQRPRPAHANSSDSLNSLFDESGHLWTITRDFRLSRYTPAPDAREILFARDVPAEQFPRQALSADLIRTLMEDHAGNIWIATTAGVDRLRRNNVRTEKQLQMEQMSGHAALAAGDGGALWLGLSSGSFGRVAGDGLWYFDGRLTRVHESDIDLVTAVNRAADGTLWVGTSTGIWHSDSRSQFHQLPSLPAPASGDLIHMITADKAGDPWVSMQRGRLFRFHNGAWQLNGGLSDLPEERPQTQALDSSGRMWFGYANDHVDVVDADRVIHYGPADGVRVGLVRAIHSGRYTIIAGESVVEIEHEGRFHSMTGREVPTALEGVSGIVETRNGDLWLNGFQGAVHIAARDLDEALRAHTYSVAVEVFDSGDGFPGMAPAVRPLPSMIEGTDGRLWFTGTQGVGWIDPDHIQRNPNSPTVLIRSLVADHMVYSGDNSARLPERTRDLQITYTALNFTRPERVRFRYRLEGYDKDWIDSGGRRQAFYTNLAPGDYRFRVIAANESGVWNNTGASVSIRISPAFTQTRTFIALCALAASAILWVAYFLRMRQVTSRERERLEERLRERERIASDLHDTLLQGVQWLILRFHLVAQRIAPEEQTRQVMDQALDRAEALLVEGRDRVRNLRSGSELAMPLEEVLRSTGEQMASGQSTRLRVIEIGKQRDLHPVAQEEVARIAIEAMFNAFRHAMAKQIEVELIYQRKDLRVSVRDDGCGMDASVLREGREGHFGLPGMRERARHIKAELAIRSRPGAGTEITLVVPAATAYAPRRKHRQMKLREQRNQ